MRIYLDLAQMIADRNTGKWHNECVNCNQTEGAKCEPVSKKHPIGKCPGFITG